MKYNDRSNNNYDNKKAVNFIILDFLMGKMSGIQTA